MRRVPPLWAALEGGICAASAAHNGSFCTLVSLIYIVASCGFRALCAIGRSGVAAG